VVHQNYTIHSHLNISWLGLGQKYALALLIVIMGLRQSVLTSALCTCTGADKECCRAVISIGKIVLIHHMQLAIAIKMDGSQLYFYFYGCGDNSNHKKVVIETFPQFSPFSL
jgi:hypothetical protein